MVVSGSPIASEVGRDILRRGGNAVDAAVAVGFALAVVHPEAGNLGGGGFMVIRTGGRRGARARLPRDGAGAGHARHVPRCAAASRTDRSVTGHLAAGRAGRGRRAGRGASPVRATAVRATVIEPAIRLAREGFVVDDYRSGSIAERQRPAGALPRLARELPARRRAAGAGIDAAAARPGRDARAIRDHGRGRVLPRAASPT